MKQKELDTALIHILGRDTFVALERSKTPLPRICDMAAVECFMYKIDNRFSETLRYAMESLKEKGQFEFED